jgi:hypothetical protein
MKRGTAHLLPTGILGFALFGVSLAKAAELPKEGTFGGTYTAYATFKPLANLDKERSLIAFDENGLSIGHGITDHMTWHCFGVIDLIKGVGQNTGHCVGTDPSGDQIVFEYVSEKFSPDKPTDSTAVNVKLTSGSGKYAGITGSHVYKNENGTSKSSAEGTALDHGTFEGTYKLP